MAEWGSLLRAPGGYMEGPSGNAEQGSITAPGGANTRAASYLQLWASTPILAHGLLLGAVPSTSNVHTCFEIGVGGVGGEVNVVQDFCFSGNSRAVYWFYVPVCIPAGSRLSGRNTCSTGSSNALAFLHLLTDGPMGIAPGKMYALGIDPTAGAYGTDVLVNVGSHNATWTQVTASCPADIRAICFTCHTNSSNPASQGLQYQVGVGSAGNEVPIIDCLNVMSGGGGDLCGRSPTLWLPCQIPAGQRIAVRVEGNSTADTVTVALYGLG